MDVDCPSLLLSTPPNETEHLASGGGGKGERGWDVRNEGGGTIIYAKDDEGRQQQRVGTGQGGSGNSSSFGASMLLTPPASLPTSAADGMGLSGQGLRPLVSPEGPFARPVGNEAGTTPLEEEEGRTLEGEEGDLERGTTPPFQLDEPEEGGEEEMQVDNEGDALTSSNPFSSTRPIPRPLRTRYASSHSSASLDPDLDLEFTTAPPLSAQSSASTSAYATFPLHKRTHSQVSPASSAGRTPPPQEEGAVLPVVGAGGGEAGGDGEAPLGEEESAIDPFHLALSGLARSPSPDLDLDLDFDHPTPPSLLSSSIAVPTLPSAQPSDLTPFLSYDAQRARPFAAPLAPATSFTSVLASGARAPTPPIEVSGSGSGLLRRRARSSTATSSSAFSPSAGNGTRTVPSGSGSGERSTSSKRRRSGTLSLSFGGGGTNGTSGSSSAGGGGGESSGRRSAAAAPRLSLGCFPVGAAGGTGVDEFRPPLLRPTPPTPALQPQPQSPTLALLRPRSPTVRPFLSPVPGTSTSSSGFFTSSSLTPPEFPSAPTPTLSTLFPSLRSPTPPAADEPTITESSFRSLARRSSALQARGDDLLREAEVVLRRTDRTLARIEAEDRERERRERRREEEVRERLPSPPRGRPRDGQVVVGVRRGAGWGAPPSSATSATTAQEAEPASAGPSLLRARRRSSLFSSFSSTPAPTPPTLTRATTTTGPSPSLTLNRSPTSPSSPPPFSTAFAPAPTSPTSPGSSTSTSAARARQFLTQLRARRPRLSRNGTTVSPPLSPAAAEQAEQTGAEGPFFSSAVDPAPPAPALPAGPFTLLRSLTLPSPPSLPLDLAPPLSGYDESAELAAAARLNERVLERRRVSERLEAGRTPSPFPSSSSAMLQTEPETALWGERVGGNGGGGAGAGGRMRGPTQSANERWRRGERPFSVAGTTTGTTFASASSSSSSAFPSSGAGVAAGSGPALVSGGRRSNLDEGGRERDRRWSTPLGLQRDEGAGAALRMVERNGAATEESRGRTPATEEGDRHWWRTEGSPSPQSRRTRTLSTSSFLDTRPSASTSTSTLNAPSTTGGAGGGPSRPSPFRLPRPSLAAPPRLRSGRSVLFGGEEGDEAAAAAEEGRLPSSSRRPSSGLALGGGGWAALSTLPPMLASGSDGRRAGDGLREGGPRPGPQRGFGRAGERGMWETGSGGGGRVEIEESAQGDGEAVMHRQRSRSPFGFFGPTHMTDPPPPSRLPSFGFETSRDSSSSFTFRRLMPWDDPEYVGTAAPRFDPFGDHPSLPSTAGPSSSTATTTGGAAPPRSSLADALARFDSRPSSRDTDWRETLRRRHPNASSISPTRSGDEPPSSSSTFATTNNPAPGASTLANALDSVAAADARIASVEERLAQHRQSRIERLAQMRRERNVVRSLLGGTGGGGDSPPPLFLPGQGGSREAVDGISPPASPGSPGPSSPRRRTLDRLLRTLGGGHGGAGERRGFAIWDDDFAGFFGLGEGRFGDSAALDPRNYLSDDTFDDSYEALLRLSERLGEAKPKGVPQSKLDQLRRFKYVEWPAEERGVELQGGEDGMDGKGKGKERAREGRLAVKGLEKEARCPVCLCDYDDDDAVLQTTCGHGFHEDCLTAWLKEHASCPVCRRDHAT